MTRFSVTSSVLSSVSYDPATLILELEFHSGRVYAYYNIPLETYEGLMRAESKGKYFCSHIRGVGYFDRME
jgi:hypothetical protein